jgi:hypothetical protein
MGEWCKTCDIKSNRIMLMEFVTDCDGGAGPPNCKSMKVFTQRGGYYPPSVVQWEVSKSNISLCSMCLLKAKFFHEALGMEGGFNASTGWLTIFKKWYGVHETAVEVKTFSASDTAANTFCTDLQKPVQKENLKQSNIKCWWDLFILARLTNENSCIWKTEVCSQIYTI